MTSTPTQARQQIANLIDRYRALDEATRKTTSEASVVHQFIMFLLEALGWPARAIRLSANGCAMRSTHWWRISTA